MMNDRTRERQIRLKDKCRGRFGYPGTEAEIYQACEKCNGCRQKDPVEHVYNVPEKGGYISEAKYNKMPNCIIVFSTEPSYYNDGKPYHSCLCGFRPWFVKSFKDNKLEITKQEDEAYQFFSDTEVDECMKYIISKKSPWTIAIWEYTGNKLVSECVHYPNENWWMNKSLQPSLMYKSVADWMKEHNEL